MAGLEPTISESKSGVLPLHYIPIFHRGRHGQPLSILWGGIWGSNPRHPEPQSGALPTELIPPYSFYWKKSAGLSIFFRRSGTPRGIRTPDLLLRRQLLYPAELLAHIVKNGAGDENRTHVSSLEGWRTDHCTTPASVNQLENNIIN